MAAVLARSNILPYSSKAFDQVLVDHIRRLNPTKILDVGVGSGKNS